jgi:multiple sugar transport system substrate-binding protein
MFYNKDMFDKAHVAYPTTKWTYQDFLNAARKLTLKDSSGKVTQWAIGGTNPLTGWWATYAPWLRGFGGDLLTRDGKHSNLSAPGSLAGLQALADLVLKYKVEPGPSVVFSSDPFVSGHAAIEFSVHGAVAAFKEAIGKKFKWDVQVVPSFPNGSRWNGMGTAGWAVSAGSKNRAAAWDIVKFVGSVQGQTALAKLGVTTPIRKSMRDSSVWQTPGLNNQAFIQAIKTGMLPPQLTPLDSAINCGTVYFGLTDTTIATMFSQILHGTPVARAAKTADAAINRCVNSLGS